MNLTALNPNPTTGLQGSVSEAVSPAAPGTRLGNEALNGADFARLLHHQVQAFKQQQRPNFAVSDKGLPSRPPEKNQPRGTEKTSADDASNQSSPDPSNPSAKVRHTPEKKQAQGSSVASKAQNATQAVDEASHEDASAVQDLDGRNPHAWVDPAMADEKSTKENVTGAESTHIDPSDKASNDLDPTEPNANPSVTLGWPSTSTHLALTTLAVSDNLQIITTAQPTTNDQSVADYALAMGLDPSQVKALFGESATQAATAKLAQGQLTTQQMLGMQGLPSAPILSDATQGLGEKALTQAPLGSLGTLGSALLNSALLNNQGQPPVSTADFQALKTQTETTDAIMPNALNAMMNVSLQVGTQAATGGPINPMPASTLAVLSMMDSQLRAEDIEALKTEFDANHATDLDAALGRDGPLGTVSTMPNRTAPTQGTAPGAPAFANNPDLAQTYDQLSQKLTTELAARMHEKLNAGEWKMKFALKPASLGLVDVQLEMRDGKLSAHFQPDTALTQDLLQNSSQRLKDALADLGLNQTSVSVSQGQTQGQSGRSTRSTPLTSNREKLSEEPGLNIAVETGHKRNALSQFDSYA